LVLAERNHVRLPLARTELSEGKGLLDPERGRRWHRRRERIGACDFVRRGGTAQQIEKENKDTKGGPS